jgi:hypothetical protein
VAAIHSLAFGAEDPPPQDVTVTALFARLPPDKAREVAELVHGALQR